MKYENIQKLRKLKNLQQWDIAKVLNMTQNQYSRYERGAVEIPLHHLITLAKYYNVSLDYLAGITDMPYPLPSNQSSIHKSINLGNINIGNNSKFDIKQ